ncbi:unnamed protein product [Acanthocheilonema viteae]|uniref:Uncharacterized protein n=1 Tax=Acanthocheilonema viteae TaxID=6277 RepID=A0A498SG32_ACAVI|nr:unnamed protein product [Acanthocheilonema viteae]
MEDLDETEVVPHQSHRPLNGCRFLAMFRERGSHLSIIELEIAHDNICGVSCLRKGEVIIVCPCPSGPIIHSVVVRPEDSPISPPKEPLTPLVEADNCTQHALTDENAQKYWPSVVNGKYDLSS